MEEGSNAGIGHRVAGALVLVGVVTAFVALTAIDARATYGTRVTSDEPQYLLTALSVGEDLDLDISDEIAAQQYRPFHELELNPQTIPLDAAGRELSPHDPLLPVLVAVPMRLGGWLGVKVALALIAGVTAAATLWVAVRRYGVDVGVGALVVGACFVSPPLTSYGTQVYPEMPAALAAMAGLAAVTGPLRSKGLWLLAASVVALPWLAVKYVPVAAVLVAVAGVRLYRRGDRRTLVSTAGFLALAGLVYLVVHQRVYGGWTVYASGDHFVDGEFRVIGSDPDYVARSRRVVGLLVDREFGILPWAPAYLALVPAIGLMVWRRPPGWAPLVGIVAASWFTATWIALTMHGWWWPGRQLVAGLPAAVVAMAVLAHRVRAWLVVVVVGGALGAISWIWLAYEASTHRRTLIVDFAETANPWYRTWSAAFPDHRSWSAGTAMWSLMWAAALIAAVWTTRGTSPTSTHTPERVGSLQ